MVKKSMKKILVFNVNWLGDVIFSSPLFRALKETHPQAKISCLAVPRVREILESIPYIDDIMVYDEKGRHRSSFAKLRLIREMSIKKFDACFLLHRSLTRALMVFLAGIPVRVGYDTKDRGGFLTHKVNPLPEPLHRGDYYLHVIESFGIPVKDRTTELRVFDEAEGEIQEFLNAQGIQKEDPVIVVNPGGNWDLKRWPKEKFTLLLKQLLSENSFRVVISGGTNDTELITHILAPLGTEPVNLAGKLSLKQLMALMKRAQVVVSADSGPLHMAASVGTQIIGLYGPTRPEITGPRGKGRALILQRDVGCNRDACYHLQCPDNTCMQAVTVENVLDAIRQVQNS